MAEKKYQVFISSTFKDLQEERRKILDVLLMADCIPAGMELFVATDDEQFEIIKKVIDLCDYYILLIGKCYGTVNDETGLSYTEMEYNYAKEQGIPVLVFAIDEGVKLSDDKSEHNEDKINALKKFRDNAMSNRLASIWKNAEELVGECSISIMKAKNSIERAGWQRATDYDEASLRREIMDLQNDNEKLKNKLLQAEKSIKSFTAHSDLSFEKYIIDIKFHYFDMSHEKRDFCKKISLVQIFIIIAVEMTDVWITEKALGTAINNKLNPDRICYYDDNQTIKVILLQLQGLELIDSSWNNQKGALYWGLTMKGSKTRDDLVLKRDIIEN